MNFTQKGTVALLGKFFAAILGLLISVLLARFLKVSGVGQYQLLLSTQVLIITILAMGFGNASIYFINSEKIEKRIIVSNLFKVFIVIAFLLALILGFCLLNFVDYFGKLKIGYVIVFVIGSASLLIYNILMPVLYASLEIVKLQILNLTSSILLCLGIFLFHYFFLIDINIAIFLVGLGNLVSTLLLLFYLKGDINCFEKLDYNLIKKLFFYGIKISASNFVFILSSNIVVFLIKIFLEEKGFESLGLFSRATSIANMFLLLPATLGPLFYSKWASISKEKLHFEVEKVLRLMVFITSSCAILIFIFGEYIIRFLYGINFLGAKNSLGILSVSVIFSSITIILSVVFSSIGKPLVMLKIFISSLILTTLLSVILIPLQGIEGAAFSVLIGIMFNAFLLSYTCNKEINFSLLNSLFITKQDLLFFIKAVRS